MANRLERLWLLSLMALCSVNVWTGAPLLALWIGARVQGDTTGVKMSSLFTIIVVLAGVAFALVQGLQWLTERYERAAGIERARRQTPWLRAMSGERQQDVVARKTTGAEYVIIGSVVLAVLAFEVWFFFFSGSPIGGSGTRS